MERQDRGDMATAVVTGTRENDVGREVREGVPGDGRHRDEDWEPSWLGLGDRDVVEDVDDALWHDSETSGLSEVPGALGRVAHGLGTLGLAPEVVEDLLSLLTGAAAHRAARREQGAQGVVLPSQEVVTDDELVRAASAVRRVQGFAEAVAVSVCRSLTERAGQDLLARKGATVPDELSAGARERWRAKTKSAVAHELSVATGHTLWRTRSLVCFAAAPRVAAAPVEAALRRGVTHWRAVDLWWSRCRRMDVADATAVAEEVFGPLLDHPVPDDPQGTALQESLRRESWAEFRRRLDREVVRVDGADSTAARKRRRAAVETRGVSTELYDDGLSCLKITGSTEAVVGAADRIETIARRARAAGDPRPQHHIRADTAMALLVHGTLPLPDAQVPSHRGADTSCDEDQRPRPGASCPGDEPLVGVPQEVSRIISGLPATRVELVMPLSALHLMPSAPRPRRGGAAGAAGAAGVDDEGEGEGSDRGSVAELSGHGFISAEHARELLLAPGTTVHRILTDPADGRVVERSTTAYRPDRQMTEQVRAVDRVCRAPGCLVPARRCDLDHEHPFNAGGTTSESNFSLKHRAHHALKTEGFWATVIDATRTVTWRTLFGRVYSTRPHDYRQYDTVLRPAGVAAHATRGAVAPEPVASGDDAWGGIDPGGVTDGDLRSRLVYAALSSRAGQDRWLEALDDHDEHADCLDGRRRPAAQGVPHHGCAPTQRAAAGSADPGADPEPDADADADADEVADADRSDRRGHASMGSGRRRPAAVLRSEPPQLSVARARMVRGLLSR
ncbi:HNH endonuclease signature motif containing protein [Ornithinimicrobium sediminis]|uniref:HNH endonuclease signature motif containing protein n=1 Tax=Ornithinimicrobium sediminis TaxID=2904603 RepID=UPI001E549C4B|nr:HNH endonuclease signature motif containing protein [Ornithinimicrobium sediminis]MCE0487055.1 HNH endonuclease [Ornithinimicrobium sediminis]